MNYDAVFEGGGVKICGHNGAIAAIEDAGFTPSHLAGVSAGAIIASCRAAGYTPVEIKKILDNLDFTNVQDDGFGGPPRMIYNLVNHFGLYKGDWFYNYMKNLLQAKGVKTFGDLVSSNPTDQASSTYRWRLKVYSADVSTQTEVVFPDDAALYGLEPDKMEVALAVRASMAIPAYFYPIKLNGRYLVDGGTVSNFPIDTFDSIGTPAWPTFGLLLEEDEPTVANIEHLHDFIFALVGTMLSANDKRRLKPEEYKYRTIQIPVGHTKAIDFSLSQEDKTNLYNSGYNAAKQFLQNWNFKDYQEWYTQLRA